MPPSRGRKSPCPPWPRRPPRLPIRPRNTAPSTGRLGFPPSKERILADIEHIDANGGSGYMINSGGRQPKYLSPEYMDLFKFAVDECKKRGMKMWIDGDDGYPDGFAGGMISQDYPQLGMQGIIADAHYTVAGGQTLNIPLPADTLGIVANPRAAAATGRRGAASACLRCRLRCRLPRTAAGGLAGAAAPERGRGAGAEGTGHVAHAGKPGTCRCPPTESSNGPRPAAPHVGGDFSGQRGRSPLQRCLRPDADDSAAPGHQEHSGQYPCAAGAAGRAGAADAAARAGPRSRPQ